MGAPGRGEGLLNTVDVMREVNAGAELKWELAAKMADMGGGRKKRGDAAERPTDEQKRKGEFSDTPD